METSISPITLSSSRSSVTSSATPCMENSEKCDSVITIVSSDFERMNVGWKGRKTKTVKCSVPKTSVSNIQKVADWIKSIEESNKFNNEKEIGSVIYESDNDKSSNLDDKGKGFVVVRCDYLKQVTSKTDKCFSGVQNSKPLINQEMKTKVYSNNLSASMPKGNKYNSDVKENSFSVIDKQPFAKDSPSSSIKLMEEKSDESSDLCDLPKSIEIRKKELCTYLKLMDPSDKKEILALQNRRSTRVRNLTALQERIKLEKKIGENVEKHTEKQDKESTDIKFIQTKCKTLVNTSPNTYVVHNENRVDKQCSAIESYNELSTHYSDNQDKVHNMDHSDLEDTNYIKRSFYFPFPQTNLASKIQNFDTVMKKLVPKFKTSIAKRSRKKAYLKNAFQSKSLSRNKENIHCTENNVEERKIELQSPCEEVSTKHSLEKQSSEKINELKCKSQIDLLLEKQKNEKLTNKNATSKLQNGKLRSAKFKIRLKRIPTRRDFIKSKKKVKQHLNGKFLKKTKFKKPSFKKEITTSKKTDHEQVENANKHQEENFCSVSPTKCISVPAIEMESETINSPTESENGASIHLQNMLVDINDFNQLSDEHKKCLIESRLFLSTTSSSYKETQILQSPEELPPLYGFSTSDVNEINIMCEMFEQSILKHSQNCTINSDDYQPKEIINSYIYSDTMMLVQNTNDLKDHSYISPDNINNSLISDEIPDANSNSNNNSEKKCIQNRYLEINPNDVEENNCDILPYNKNVEIKSLQKSLHIVRKKNIITSPEVHVSHEWELDESPRPKPKRLSHYISINKENGGILKAFYVDFNLVLCQEFSVSFWMQTPLGKFDYGLNILIQFIYILIVLCFIFNFLNNCYSLISIICYLSRDITIHSHF